MVRKQNERTILLQYRIIQLSLPTNSTLSYFSVSPPFYKIGGFLFPPKHFPTNFFRNFFQSDQGDFFLYFWCEKLCFLGANFFLLLWREKLWGLKALVAPQMGGGVPFRMLSTQQGSLHFFQLLRVPFLPSSWQIFRQSGQKGAKVNFFLLALVFSRENRRPKGAKY